MRSDRIPRNAQPVLSSNLKNNAFVDLGGWFLPIFYFNGRFLKIYKNECLEPLGSPNKLKIEMDSLWGILKKIIYQIFDILIFRDFLDPEKCKIGKNHLKMAIFGLSGAIKSQKIKISKIW